MPCRYCRYEFIDLAVAVGGITLHRLSRSRVNNHGTVSRFFYLSAVMLAAVCCKLTAADGPVPFQPSNPLPPPSNPPIKQIGPGVFELGNVRFDKKTRTVSFQGSVNMKEGLIEYLLVHGSGKIHESLFRTEVEPYHVHLAVLLLSERATGKENPPPASELTAVVRNVRIWVEWTDAGKKMRVPAEDLIENLATKKTMSQGPWRYVGSRVIEGMFLAQRDGSMIAVIDDPDALINNARPGAEDDENWQIHAAELPGVGVPLTISIELETSKQSTIDS